MHSYVKASSSPKDHFDYFLLASRSGTLLNYFSWLLSANFFLAICGHVVVLTLESILGKKKSNFLWIYLFHGRI
jgi:hypothetical protein